MHITCKPITERGNIALRKSIDDNKAVMKTYSFAQRQEFYKIWQEVIRDNPLQYTLILRARSSLGASYYITKQFTKGVNSAKEFNTNLNDKWQEMVNEIDQAMKENGATPILDYTIEVVK